MRVASSLLDTTGSYPFPCSDVQSAEHCRSSLVTTLRAAEKFEKEHLSSPEVAPLVENAKLFYVEGFFLTHGSESALELSKKASEAGKVGGLSLPSSAGAS